MSVTFFNGQSSDASSDVYSHSGGQLSVFVHGNFGGGQVVLEARAPELNAWVPVANGVWDAPEVRILEMPPASIRARLVGATSADLNVSAQRF